MKVIYHFCNLIKFKILLLIYKILMMILFMLKILDFNKIVMILINF